MHWVGIPLIALSGVLVLSLVICFCRRARRRRLREVQLHAPLLATSTDHRLDAAMRAAEDGVNVCPACRFDNFRRSPYCTVCGEALPELEDEDESTPRHRMSLRQLEERLSRRKVRLSRSASTTMTRYADAPDEVRDRRQRRARNRKEWQRKRDVEGKVYWFRKDAPDLSEHDKWYSPGVVVEITTKPVITTTTAEREATTADLDRGSGGKQSEDKADTTPSETDNDPSSPVVAVHTAEPTTMAARAQILRKAFETLDIKIVEAAQAVPTRLPLADRSLTEDEQNQQMKFFAHDFPTKYAHFVTRTANLLVPAAVAHLRLNVHRDTLYRESIESLAVIRRDHLRSVMRINFLGESGVDAGGVQREWFSLCLETVVAPQTGLFRCVDRTEQTFYLNPHSRRDIGENHLAYFFATGRLLGRALLEGHATGMHLTLPLLKIILGLPVNISDLEFFDPEMYTNMKWMMEHDNVEDILGLDFTICERVVKEGGEEGEEETVTVELVPGGRDIVVTDDNKLQYLECKFRYLLFGSVAQQLYAFLQGLYEVIPQELLMIFDPEELDFVLCGSDEIDVADWERNAKYTKDLHGQAALRWFWEIVDEMPNEYRRRLLLFSTGSSRVPLAGFRALTSYDGKLCPFTLRGVPLRDEGYVVSHACFNRIDLPYHTDRSALKTVLYATLNTELYGFTKD